MQSERKVNSPTVHFGAAYYPEYQRTNDVEADLDLMKAAGFTVIRVGESVWSTWEPEEGVFDVEWLRPALDAAEARGIGVILGTPTYAAPPWLQRRHPEIVADTATGLPMQWGARQEMDFTHGAFRFYAERIIRKVVETYKDHPAVIGFQVDNEPGIRILYNDSVFQEFVDRLRRTYGSVERLNEEWGLVYWSHRLSTWADLWRPDGNAQPQYDLAWRRFQADLVTEYIAWQANIVQEIAGPDTLVTTCISYDQVAVADADLSRGLSVASGNAYYEMQDSLRHPNTTDRAIGTTAWIVRGPWALSELADTMYSSKQAPFLVTETNAGSIGNAFINQSPYDGQWRQAAWLLVARGARMIEYWHWNTLEFGAETYWGGVLPHDGVPGRAYEEIARIGNDFAAIGGLFDGAEPDYDITVLFDSDSKFALARQAPFRAPGAGADHDAYRRLVAAFTRGVFDAKRQTRFIRPIQLFPSRGAVLDAAAAARAYPVLVVPAFYTAADEELVFLRQYAHAGGHLVIGPKTGAGDREGRARTETKPAFLADAAGVSYVEFANPDEPLDLSTDPTIGSATMRAIDFVEGLEASTALSLARYIHPHFGRWSAMTTTIHGQGQITVVGAVPDQEFARAICAWLAPEPVGGWLSLGSSVTVATNSLPNGGRVHVLHNWSWDEASAVAPADLFEPLTGEAIPLDGPVVLGPWGVRIFVTDRTPARGV